MITNLANPTGSSKRPVFATELQRAELRRASDMHRKPVAYLPWSQMGASSCYSNVRKSIRSLRLDVMRRTERIGGGGGSIEPPL